MLYFKITVFWDLTPCSLVDQAPEGESSRFLQNVAICLPACLPTYLPVCLSFHLFLGGPLSLVVSKFVYITALLLLLLFFFVAAILIIGWLVTVVVAVAVAVAAVFIKLHYLICISSFAYLHCRMKIMFITFFSDLFSFVFV